VKKNEIDAVFDTRDFWRRYETPRGKRLAFPLGLFDGLR
jgi:hypothetical protein